MLTAHVLESSDSCSVQHDLDAGMGFEGGRCDDSACSCYLVALVPDLRALALSR